MAKKIRYPENLPLRLEVFKSGRTIKSIAKAIGISRELLSYTINGHYKGINVVPKLKKELGMKEKKRPGEQDSGGVGNRG